ncbi:MAG: CoA pyrophosphatase [Candidatus Berkiella sp.]
MDALTLRKFIDKLSSEHPAQIEKALHALATQIPLFVPQDQQNLTKAAVLVPFIMHSNNPSLLLTVRTAHLLHHAGQISFPGGKNDEQEDAITCALRETQEEIGIHPDKIEVITSLGTWPSFSGFLITPVIGLITPPIQHQAFEHEVQEVFEIPLNVAFDSKRYQRVEKQTPIAHHYYELNFEEKRIWGFTAGLMLLLASFANKNC